MKINLNVEKQVVNKYQIFMVYVLKYECLAFSLFL